MPPKKHCAAECQNFAYIPQLTRLLSIRMLPLATLTMRIVGKPRDREIIPRGCSVFATIGTASLNFPPSRRGLLSLCFRTRYGQLPHRGVAAGGGRRPTFTR
jgi:hypothetical protein